MSRLGDSPFDPPGFGTLGGKRRMPREASEQDLLRRRMFEDPPGDTKIDEIRPSGRSGVLWRVSVESEEAGASSLGVARVDRSLVDALLLSPGLAWDLPLATRVLAAAHADEARRYALNALAMQAMSAQRLVDKMVRRGTPKPIAAEVVARLEDTGLVDDRAMAEQIARSILARNPSGARVIEQRLIRRSIRREVAKEVAAAMTAERDPREDALRVARKKLKGMAPRLERSVAERRLLGALARRGFPPDTCRQTARDVVAEGWPPRA